MYCSEKTAERARTFWLTPTGPGKDGIRLVEISSLVFDGPSPELEAPEAYPDVPFLELRGTRKCPIPGAQEPIDGTESRVMEAWALTDQGPRLVRRLESSSEIPAGSTRSTTGSLTWIRTEDRVFYLVARMYTYSSTPANSAPGPDDDDADDMIVRCHAESTIFQLDAKGHATVLTAKQVAALRKTVPAIGALPADGRGTTEDACSDLEGL